MNFYYSQIKKSAYSLLILLLLLNIFQVKNVRAKLYAGMKALPFTLSDLSGKSETLFRLSKGKKLTTIVFWATWNEQSSDELKRLQKSYLHYQSKGFQIIAINVESQTISKRQSKNIVSYCKKMGFTFPVLIDHNLKTFHNYSIVAIPTTFLINKEGTIVYKLPGYPIAGAEQLFSTIRKLMEPESGGGSQDQIRLPDKEALRYYQMAKVLQNKGDYSSAIKSLRKSITIDPDFLAAYNLLGIMLYETGKEKEAVEIFDRTLSKNPEDLPFLADYGNFLIQTGDAEKGLSMIRKVIKEDPNYSMGHYYLGSYFLKQGKKGESLQEAQKVVKLNPLDFNGHRLLGSVYESLGKKKESLASYKKAAILLEKKVKQHHMIPF
jgi:Tfp pilus assembly protein PilF/peroxiredoxin